MRETTKRLLAKGMLFLAALIWGSAFFMMKEVTEVIPVFWMLACRFLSAAVLLGLATWKRWKVMDWDHLWRGFVMGSLLFASYAAQTLGLQYTTPSNNAFLTSVYCVIVPFLAWAVMKIRPDRWNLLAAGLCVVGIGLVSLDETFSIRLGDGLTLLCAVFFAAQIVGVNRLSPGRDVLLLTVLQLAGVGILSLICALLFQQPPAAEALTPKVMAEFAYMVIFATVAADLFQNVGQVWSDATSASILMSLESVFGVLFSVLLYHDPLTFRLFLGFFLIFAAVICSETKLSFLRKRSGQA